MLTKRDRTAAYKALETEQRVRQENVRLLAEELGGWAQMAKLSGLSDSLLVMIAGPNPTRTVNERLARRIEIALGLPKGWLDKKH